MKILYVDHFSPRNSNGYWKTAFERAGEVRTLEIIQTHPNILIQTALQFQPDHIHLGGSVKYNAAPLETLAFLRRSLRCSLSHFYGDAAPSEYHLRSARTAYIYMSVYTYVEWIRKLGGEHIAYLPCPTDPELFRPYDLPQKYDVVFIGNHYSASRMKLLQAVNRMCSLMIYGEGWEGTDLPHQAAVYGEAFARAVSEAGLVLSIMSDEWVQLKRCFSNRLINSLACGACVIQTHTPDIESVFQDGKHLLLYEKPEELMERIEEYLPRAEARSEIGAAARNEILANYTYDRAVQRILNDGARIRREIQNQQFFTSKSILTLLKTSDLLENQPNLISPQKQRLCWGDAAGPLLPETVLDIRMDVDLLSTHSWERWDAYLEMNRVCRVSGFVILEGDAEKQKGVARELMFFGFRIVKLESGKTILQKNYIPITPYDHFWRLSMQESQNPQGRFSLRWCETHEYMRKRLHGLSLAGKILNLQCGAGQWAFLGWLAHGGEWVGIEESQWAVQYAKMTFGGQSLHFYPFTLAQTRFEPETFHHAIYLDFLQREIPLAAWINELKRILKPGGRLFLAAPQENLRNYAPDQQAEKSSAVQLPDGCGWEKWEEDEKTVYADLAIHKDRDGSI